MVTEQKDKNNFHCYLTDFYRDECKLTFKIGYTNNLERRMSEHLKRYEADDYTIEMVYTFNDPDLALIMESWARWYFKRKRNSIFIEKDRFKNTRCVDKDVDKLNEIADSIAENAYKFEKKFFKKA